MIINFGSFIYHFHYFVNLYHFPKLFFSPFKYFVFKVFNDSKLKDILR